MKLLLDTHTFIWFAENDSKLSNEIKNNIEDPENLIFISIASIWEMGIKVQLEKLSLKNPLENVVEKIEESGYIILPILPEYVIRLLQLPFHHRDPFDRMIIAQALYEDITVITKDKAFDDYKIKRIW